MRAPGFTWIRTLAGRGCERPNSRLSMAPSPKRPTELDGAICKATNTKIKALQRKLESEMGIATPDPSGEADATKKVSMAPGRGMA